MARRAAPHSPVTISQVAAAAGVSRATVSRALGRPGMLKPQTVERIRALAASMGYSPNPTARALSTGRHLNIGLIVPDVANPFFPPLIRAAQERADKAGYCVFLGNSDERPEREDTLLRRFAGQVEGIVLVSSRLPEERIKAVAAATPLVLVNRDVAGIPRVLIDTAGGIKAAVHHLAGLGHRRIVYVAGPAVSWSNRERRAAIREATLAADMELVTLKAARPGFEPGKRAVPAIIASAATAAIAFDDITSQGVLAGLAEHRRAVPETFSVIGCDDVVGTISVPPLSTISSRCREAGQAAVEILLGVLDGGAAGDIRKVLKTELIVRGTSGPNTR